MGRKSTKPEETQELTPSQRMEAFGEDAIMQRIADGASLNDLAEEIGAKRSTLHDWLHADPGRSARAKAARQRSADAYEELAEKGIREAADPFELAKAKELAHHYRWAARVRSPKTHGDKLELAGNAEAPLVVNIKRLSGD